MFLRELTLQLIDNPPESLVPADRAIMGVPWPGVKRLSKPATPLQLTRTESLQLGDGVTLEKLRLQTILHVGDHRMEGLLADLGEVAQFVAHAARLPAHAQGTGLAGVF